MTSERIAFVWGTKALLALTYTKLNCEESTEKRLTVNR